MYARAPPSVFAAVTDNFVSQQPDLGHFSAADQRGLERNELAGVADNVDRQRLPGDNWQPKYRRLIPDRDEISG
jgi:hypothetical protein